MLRCNFQYQNAAIALNVQFEMHNQIVGIVGPSGSGKSTLFKNIVGLCLPQHGQIQFDQQILFDSEQHINVAMHERKIALIFQHALVFPHMNVMQNLKYAANLSRNEAQKMSFQQVIELLELSPLLKRKAHQLSGGEAQRVSIGRALLSAPQLLLLDEPLTGLDKRLKDQILPFLKQIQDETKLPMLYVTHHHDELKDLDAEIFSLDSGCLKHTNT